MKRACTFHYDWLQNFCVSCALAIAVASQTGFPLRAEAADRPSARIIQDSRSGQAEQLFRAGRFALARLAYTSELKRTPTDINVRLGLIRTLNRLDLWREALAESRTQVAQTPDDPNARGMLALALMRAGQPEEAARISETVLQKMPTQYEALLTRGRLQLWEGNKRQANDTLRRATTLQPDNPDAWFYLLDAYEDEVSPAMLKDIDAYTALNPKGHPHELALETLPSLRSFLPHFQDEMPFSASTPISEADLVKSDKGESPTQIFALPFQTIGNYITMPVKIDGQPMNFLFDTGGGFSIALYKRAATRLPLKSLGRSSVRGVNGKENSTQAKADTMLFGTETFRYIPIDVLNSNSGEEDGIFGVSNFDHYAVTIDFAGKQLLLARGKDAVAPTPQPGDNAIQIPFHLLDGDIMIPIQVEGQKVWALVDTGADEEMILSLDVAHAIAARRKPNSYVEKRERAQVGLGNTVKQQTLLAFVEPVNLQLSTLDGKTQSNRIDPALGADLVDTQVSPSMNFQVGAILGIDYLRRAKKVTFDYPHKILTLEFAPKQTVN